MRDDTKLRAFELADQLALSIYQQTANSPREEMFGLVSQMRRTAVSAASNIVEGCARHTHTDYVHFLDMATGSVREVEYQVSLAHRLGFIPNTTELTKVTIEPSKVLNGLIRSPRECQAVGTRQESHPKLFFIPPASSLT